jgi:two-component system sensor histidine kinase KdpD
MALTSEPASGPTGEAAAGTPGSLGLEGFLLRPGPTRLLLGMTVAVAGPALVTLLALAPHFTTAVPALLYLLTVVGAAAVGQLWPGVVCAGVSFVCLDYFFTPPTRTFKVSKAEDLVALAVFLGVALVVSALISAAVRQRAEARLQAHQVQALYHVSTRLLSGDRLDDVLLDLARSFRSLYGLRGCRVLVADRNGVMRERAASGAVGPAATVVPLRTPEGLVGRIELGGVPPAGLSHREVLETFAGQLALAVERARLGEAAEEARVEAEANRIRAAVFSSVTHDLRTPLASITASASSLLEEGVPFSPEQRGELLRTILEESERLNRLVGNLMDLSRLRAGALQPSVEPVLLEDLVSSVTHRMRGALAGREVRVRIREDLPAVPVDVVQMDQVLTNLLENAVRYSPPGTEITVAAARWEDMAEVKVADRGPGIPVDRRAAVFTEFFRQDVNGQRGGTGLGLAIAAAIVSAHGGSMWIEDTPGGGTTVGFRLPLARVEAPTA